MTVGATSLFDRPVAPVPDAVSTLAQGVFGGSLATSLCVIAVAIFGLTLLTGRLQLRRGVEVVVGCLLLLGAGMLAVQLQQLARSSEGSATTTGEAIVLPQAERADAAPPANYDPYAGASLRKDR